MDPNRFDLNLLEVFIQLYKCRSVSLAAEQLGLSQPAVSAALRRLREKLGDEVFLRTARGMQPTPLADQLALPIANALGSIHENILRQISFDAKSSTRHFTLAMADIGEILFLPSLINKLSVVAPNLNISTVRSSSINLKFEMEAGKVELAIGHLPELKTDFHRRLLFEVRNVCLFRRGHAIQTAINPLEAFIAAEHAVAVSAEVTHGKVEEAMDALGVRRRIRLRVPHIVALADILESSDLVATVPDAFAFRSVKHFDLAYIEHPINLPSIEIGLFWHSKYHKDPSNQWLRQLLTSLFAAEFNDRSST
jgi:DNA-binding transcriptional LysR family regulator